MAPMIFSSLLYPGEKLSFSFMADNVNSVPSAISLSVFACLVLLVFGWIIDFYKSILAN